MFPIATMGGISGLMQGVGGISSMGGLSSAANAGSAGQGFSFMDALGSAAAKMPAGGTGKNPHLVMNPNYGMEQYKDMSNVGVGMNPLFSMMNSLQQQQQPQKQPMQMSMHPLIQQMLRMAGV